MSSSSASLSPSSATSIRPLISASSGSTRLAADEPGEVARRACPWPPSILAAALVDHDVGPGGEVVTVLGGHAEQLADDEHRQQERVLGEEVDAARPRQRVDQLVGDLADPRAQRLHPAQGEGPGDELAQPGVLRRVHEDHHRDRRAGRVGALLGRQRVAPVLGQPRVGQRGPDVGVPAEQPDRAAGDARCGGRARRRAARRRRGRDRARSRRRTARAVRSPAPRSDVSYRLT